MLIYCRVVPQVVGKVFYLCLYVSVGVWCVVCVSMGVVLEAVCDV